MKTDMTDKTSYAKSLGYKGTKKVIVVDGQVISHRGVDWFSFCEKLRHRV